MAEFYELLSQQKACRFLKTGVLSGTLSSLCAIVHIAQCHNSLFANLPPFYGACDPLPGMFVDAGPLDGVVCVDREDRPCAGMLVPIPMKFVGMSKDFRSWPVWFTIEGGVAPGLPVRAARAGCRIVGGEKRVRMHSPSFKACVVWPGYNEFQSGAHHSSGPGNTRSLDELMWYLADAVITFLFRRTDRNSTEPTPQSLSLDGLDPVRADDVTILGALNLECGLWYPILRVAPRMHGVGAWYPSPGERRLIN